MDQAPEQNSQPNPNPNGGGAGGRRRRRRRGGSKHKGAQPQGQPQAQPGNSSNGSGGGNPHVHKRQHQQGGGGQAKRRNRTGGRKQQVFVGPMDHSYRNGNLADQNSHRRPNDLGVNGNLAPRFSDSDLAPIGVPEDAPARIFCFIEDLFFVAKINETAKKLNIKVEYVKSAEPVLERAGAEIPETERPTLVVFDLNNANIKPLTVIPKLRTKLKKGTSIIGFLSHIQGELKLKAQEAGCDMVMPRSAFSQNLPNLLRRHAAPEQLEEIVE